MRVMGSQDISTSLRLSVLFTGATFGLFAGTGGAAVAVAMNELP
jgi:hypothetical protein